MSGRARLLAVATVAPWPVTNGYAVRVHHLLRRLVREWHVLLLAPGNGSADDPGAIDAERLEWRRLPWDPAWGHLPDEYDAGRVRTEIGRAMTAFRPDAVLFWGSTAALARGSGWAPPAVNDKIDCMTLQAWRDLGGAGGLRGRLGRARTLLRYARFERAAARQSIHATVVGEDDARALRRLSGHRSVHVVPNGVELGAAPGSAAEDPVPTVLFTGVLRFGPNVDAARHFATRVWPHVHAARPNARFVVAGRNPDDGVRALHGRDGIEVRANVPDLADELRRAWIAVAPMVSGSGIKNKVLEAWAESRPVVLTELAANGLSVDERMRTLVADDPERMAEIVLRLLEDADERLRLGTIAFELARDRHGWDGAAARLSSLLRAAAGGVQP